MKFLDRFFPKSLSDYWEKIADAHARRSNLLVSLSDDELSPAALAARVVLADVAGELVRQGRWIGARLLPERP